MIISSLNETSDIFIRRKGRGRFHVMVSAFRLVDSDGLHMVRRNSLPETKHYRNVTWTDVRHLIGDIQSDYPDLLIPSIVKEYFDYQSYTKRLLLWFRLIF